MKKLTLILCLLVGSVYGGWSTNFTTAQKKAKASNKLMLVNFTGKKWCGYCIKQEKNIFKKSAFKKYASKNLILVELNFKQGKKPKKGYGELKTKYSVSGFPTVLVLDSEGKQLARYGGYDSSMTVEKYVERLDKLVQAHNEEVEAEKKKLQEEKKAGKSKK